MTYVPVIYDWRSTIVPVDQVFRAGGNAVAGGMTLGGASVESPEPGGRGELVLEVAALANANSNLDASWTVSRLLNGAVFRVRLFSPTVQLVPDSALGGSTELGVMWSNGLGWAGNVPWAFDPSASVTAIAAKGSQSFTVDMAALGQVLGLGHVIGFRLEGYDFAHVVTDIGYSAANVATVTVSPPLRRALAVGSAMKFRPSFTCTCVNAREVMGTFNYGTSMKLATLRMVEVML